MKVISDKTLPDGEVEFYFSDGSFAYAEQQHGITGTPWKALGGCTHSQALAIEIYTKCRVLGVSRLVSCNEASRRYVYKRLAKFWHSFPGKF